MDREDLGNRSFVKAGMINWISLLLALASAVYSLGYEKSRLDDTQMKQQDNTQAIRALESQRIEVAVVQTELTDIIRRLDRIEGAINRR